MTLIPAANAQGRVDFAADVASELSPIAVLLPPMVLLRALQNLPCCRAGGVTIRALETVGRVAEAGGVAVERSKTSGRVGVAFGVEIERRITVGRVVVAVGVVRERISASGTVKKAARVAIERKNARGGVEAAIDIAKQGPKTGRRILVADW